jgi:pimeloyl-ACP methyl ester carboxylesterase
MNDRNILARLEAASPSELAGLLSRPSESEARVYRVYFGQEQYETLRRKTRAARGIRAAAKRGNVVILHGILGGELTVDDQGADKLVWLNYFRLAFGAVSFLRMKNGKSESSVQATGIIKKYYAEQILELIQEWNVQTFWYDWRRDLSETADDLHAKIVGWFGADAPVHLVAHSMGGLVSRTYIARHPERWNKGGKLIMLGTPNHGSFSIPQVVTGVSDTVRKLALLDVTNSLGAITKILSGMPGILQMLPSPLVMPAMAPLYKSSTWGGNIPQSLLDQALKQHESIAEIVDGARMHYIAGYNRHTNDDILDWKRLDALSGYNSSLNGDGTVPHKLGFLEQDGKRIPTWFVEEEHSALPNNTEVISATSLLLIKDDCNLPKTFPSSRGVRANRVAVQAAVEMVRSRMAEDDSRFATIVEQLKFQSRGAEPTDQRAVSALEIEAGEILVRSFLSVSKQDSTKAPAGKLSPDKPNKPDTAERPDKADRSPRKIQIAILMADITDIPAMAKNVPPVDAVAVGHYNGVSPQHAELSLDRMISGWKKGDSDDKLLLTAMNTRGSIPSQLGQNYMLPDPSHPERLAVLVGMGNPGRFARPELSVAVRELVWTLGRMGRQHLVAVLIGTGVGNLTISQAVQGWLRGIRSALSDIQGTDEPQVQRITFIGRSPANFVRLHFAIVDELERISDDDLRIEINYVAPVAKQLQKAKDHAVDWETKRYRETIQKEMDGLKDDASGMDQEPIRFTVELTGDTYKFSALGKDASVPQRDSTVDPILIDEINRGLVDAPSFERQQDLGNLLGQMLVPQELRSVIIRPGVPTVLLLDSTTARVHFEMALISRTLKAAKLDQDFDEDLFRKTFLGPAASLTRQFRTTFAPLPEPPITSGRSINVLVVADPCEESPLFGAQMEGEAVAELFEQFGRMGVKVKVVRLFGPSEATRMAVLDCLVNQHFDIVHYAGHCFYDPVAPQRSGWLFSGNQVLSANELNRVDRVPRFVFSNACESGITPDRASERSAGLAPSFAESFFARGVCNFICTAWPVDDAAALAFATRFYRELLEKSVPIHEAMKGARTEIASLGDGGRRTWGAYQHYGDPNFRIALD